MNNKNELPMEYQRRAAVEETNHVNSSFQFQKISMQSIFIVVAQNNFS